MRAAIPEDCRTSTQADGIVRFVFYEAAYLITLITLAWLPNPWAPIIMVCLNGLAMASLFVVGHDACHGTLTPDPRLNNWIANLAFLPSLHTVTDWKLAHNIQHHAWTNLREHDPGYPPYSPGEYLQLSKWKQVEARLHRTLLGAGIMYLQSVWWPHIITPEQTRREALDKLGSFGSQLIWIGCYAALLTVAETYVGRRKGMPMPDASLEATWLLAGPFLIFSWLIGIATYLQHTNPMVRWYDNQDEWKKAHTQLTATVHIALPRWIELLTNDIMQHPAHHLDTIIPLYKLAEAERALELKFGERMTISRLGLRDIQKTLRTCRLYDYKTHSWHDWDGRALARVDAPSTRQAEKTETTDSYPPQSLPTHIDSHI